MADIRTPDEWCKATGLRVLDPDGWRAGVKGLNVTHEPKAWTAPITLVEFRERVYASTCDFRDCPVGRVWGLEPLND